jgi:hypothetical protein
MYFTQAYPTIATFSSKSLCRFESRPRSASITKKLVADPHFVPFTLTLNWNSFHVVSDIAIATSVFDGEVTKNGKQTHFRGKNMLVCLQFKML